LRFGAVKDLKTALTAPLVWGHE